MKMRGPCIVYGCNNDGVHQLPKDETMKTQWIAAAKLEIKLKAGRSIKTYTYFCSEHFKDSDFYYTRPLFDGDEGNKLLKKGSVPSIFPWTVSQAEVSQAEVSQVKATTSIKDSEDHDIRFDPGLIVQDYSKNCFPIKFVEEVPYFIEIEHNDPSKDPLELSDGSSDGDSKILTSDCCSLQLDNILIVSDTVPMEIDLSDFGPIFESSAPPNHDTISYNDVSIQTVRNHARTANFAVGKIRSHESAKRAQQSKSLGGLRFFLANRRDFAAKT